MPRAATERGSVDTSGAESVPGLALPDHLSHFALDLTLRGVQRQATQIEDHAPVRTELMKLETNHLAHSALHAVALNRLAQRSGRSKAHLGTIAHRGLPAKRYKASAWQTKPVIVDLSEFSGA
jgi:hypothetical protein